MNVMWMARSKTPYVGARVRAKENGKHGTITELVMLSGLRTYRVVFDNDGGHARFFPEGLEVLS